MQPLMTMKKEEKQEKEKEKEKEVKSVWTYFKNSAAFVFNIFRSTCVYVWWIEEDDSFGTLNPFVKAYRLYHDWRTRRRIRNYKNLIAGKIADTKKNIDFLRSQDDENKQAVEESNLLLQLYNFEHNTTAKKLAYQAIVNSQKESAFLNNKMLLLGGVIARYRQNITTLVSLENTSDFATLPTFKSVNIQTLVSQLDKVISDANKNEEKIDACVSVVIGKAEEINEEEMETYLEKMEKSRANDTSYVDLMNAMITPNNTLTIPETL